MGEHDNLRPEVRDNLAEFLRDLAELTARTGIKVGEILPGTGSYLDTVTGEHTVAKNLRYNEAEAVYETDEVEYLEPEVRNFG